MLAISRKKDKFSKKISDQPYSVLSQMVLNPCHNKKAALQQNFEQDKDLKGLGAGVEAHSAVAAQ